MYREMFVIAVTVHVVAVCIVNVFVDWRVADFDIIHNCFDWRIADVVIIRSCVNIVL